MKKLVIACAATALLLAAPAAAQTSASSARWCGTMRLGDDETTFKVQSQNLICLTARANVARYVNKNGSRPAGYRCTENSRYFQCAKARHWYRGWAVASPAPPPPSRPGFSRDNPLPLGQAVDMSFSSSNETWRLRILALDFDAWPEIQAENIFNDPPAPGFQYVMAAVEVTYVSGTSPKRPWFTVAGSLKTVGASNVAYNQYDNLGCGVTPDDFALKDTEVFPPGTLSGNVCWPVRSSDVPTLLAYLTFTSGPFWMALR